MGDLNGATVAGGFRPPGAHGARFVDEGFLRPAHRSFNHPDGRPDDIAANDADDIACRLPNSGARVGRVSDRFTFWTGATGQKRGEDENSTKSAVSAQIRVHKIRSLECCGQNTTNGPHVRNGDYRLVFDETHRLRVQPSPQAVARHCVMAIRSGDVTYSEEPKS